MDNRQFRSAIDRMKSEILQEVNDRLPRKLGIIAVNHFKQNFRDAGFTDNGLQPWKTTKRQMSGGPDAGYNPLNSRRMHLMSSIQMRPMKAAVMIENNVPYALIHNEGGDLTTMVTPKMRRYAWHMAYSLAHAKDGKLPPELPPEALKWKRLALTKKTKLNIHIPQRKFIGESRELTDKVNKAIYESLEKIKNGILNH